MTEQLDLVTLNRTFAQQVIPGRWEKMFSCTQSGKCTASFPAAHPTGLSSHRMCPMNLNGHQNSAFGVVGQSSNIRVLFRSGLVGSSVGLPGSELLCHQHAVPVESVEERLSEGESAAEPIEG